MPKQHLNHASLSHPIPISFLSHSHPIPIHHYISPAPAGIITLLTTPQAVSIHGSRSLSTPLLSLSLLPAFPCSIGWCTTHGTAKDAAQGSAGSTLLPKAAGIHQPKVGFGGVKSRKAGEEGEWRGGTRCCFETHIGSMSAGIPTQGGCL